MLRYIPADLKRDYPGQPYAASLAKCGPEIAVGTGTRGAIATDRDGNIHLVYVNGGMKYRKIDFYASSTSVDYDADGITSTAMLHRALEMIGAAYAG